MKFRGFGRVRVCDADQARAFGLVEYRVVDGQSPYSTAKSG